MSNQKTLLDFQSDWVELVSKAMSNYNSLSKNERIWFNIESLIGQVSNGGLISHYYNSGADNNKDTIEDLISLGLPNVADLLVEMNKLFPNGKPSVDINERNRVISNWPDGKYSYFMDQLDKKFYKNIHEVEDKLILHIEITMQ